MRTISQPVARHRFAAVFAPLVLLCSLPVHGLLPADVAGEQPVITLAKPAGVPAPLAVNSGFSDKAGARERVSRENYREFQAGKVGREGSPELFTLEFHAATKVTGIAATGDFHVSGGSCSVGHVYAASDVCDVEVTFAPKGPGHRTGQLSVAHSAAAKPFLTPIGGTAYGPAVQFVPSEIFTLPFTVSNYAGTLLDPGQLTVDGQDSLYIADAGNNLVKKVDSSGIITPIIGGGTVSLDEDDHPGTAVKLNNPYGVGVAFDGTVFVADSGDSIVAEYSTIGEVSGALGGGTSLTSGGCSYTSPCSALNSKIFPPTSLAVDTSGNVYFAEAAGAPYPGSRYLEFQTGINGNYDLDYFFTASNGNSDYSSSNALSVDPFGYGNLYTAYLVPNGTPQSATPFCNILGKNAASADDTEGGRTWTVAGSGPCGFSGDGGKAGNAEISGAIGQFSWDSAGNFYFTDTGNNRVRRIDGLTGVIRTIAGNGVADYSGDGGPSTGASIDAPVGLAVDSTGLVYVTGQTAVGPAPVNSNIREFGTVGELSFGNQVLGSHSAAQTVLVSNVGNDDLNFTHTGFTSGNTADFAVDPNTTSCDFTVPLVSGHSCNVGFIFTPGATGARSAVFSLLDDTVTGVNTVQLTGVGVITATLSPVLLTFPSTAVGSTSAAQTATLTNTGGGILAISGISFAGSGASSFAQTTTCGATLAAGASCTFSVTFKPTASGTLAAMLNVSDNANSGLQVVSLTGTGAASTATPVLSPTSLTFAAQAVGSSSTGQQIKLTNTGSGALGLTSIKLTGTNAGDFAINTNCTSTVNAGAACLVNVVFKPTATGTRTATLTYASSVGTLTAAITGNGVAAAAKPVLSPTPLAFGSQTVATAGAAKAFTLTNTGTASLTTTSFAFTGTNAGDFSQTHTCGATLAAGASCAISVVFKPEATGARTATLLVSTSAGSVSAAVSGTGAVATKVALASGANPAIQGQMLSLAVQVSAASGGQASAYASVPATGQVQLMEGGRVLAEGSLGGGAVTLRIGNLSPGLHVLRAVYLGDANYGVSVSNAINQLVSAGDRVPGPVKPGRLD